MILPKEKASKLICPFMTQGQVIPIGIMGDTILDINNINCQTDKCMAWEIEYPLGTSCRQGYCKRLENENK